MKVLLLAPQPFYQERGTPIAVRLAAEALAERYQQSGHVDLLVYHEGDSINLPGVQTHRIKGCSFIKGVGPGISIKKLICDLFFFFTALGLVFRNRGNQYNVVHAVEESVFVALFIKFIFKIPYVYDMDSSIALQAAEKWKILTPLYPILSWFEKLGVKHSTAVVPVCDSLAAIADNHGSQDTHILRDVSLMSHGDTTDVNLRAEINAKSEDIITTYIGNLESYQGVELLIESFIEISGKVPNARLVIIGGSAKHLEAFKKKFELNKFSSQIKLLGPRPVQNLGAYLTQSDILASPRIKGNNTPMKVYSYLHAGKPVIATNLPTHTQVLNSSVSMLVEPTVESMSAGLVKLISDQLLRKRLGQSAYEYAEQNFTLEVFRLRLNELYARLEKRHFITVDTQLPKEQLG